MRLFPLLVVLACGEAEPDHDDTSSSSGEDTDPASDTDVPSDSGDTGSFSEPDDSAHDPGDWPPEDYTALLVRSGRRLVAHALRSEEGNHALAWFTDTQLGVRCRPGRTQDGAIRCIPEGIFGAAGHEYADAGCTEPAILASAWCGDAQYAYNQQSGDYRVFEITGESASGYLSGGSSCHPDTSWPGKVRLTFTELDLNDLVAFSDHQVPLNDEVSIHVRRGSDGSRYPVGLWHNDDDQPLWIHDVGTLRAVPAPMSVWYEELYPTTCEGTDTAVLRSGTDPAPPYVIYHPASAPAVLREVTGTASTICLNDGPGTTGNPYEPALRERVLVLGEATIPLTDYPEVDVRTDDREGRRFRHYTLPDGTPLLPEPPGTGRLPVFARPGSGGALVSSGPRTFDVGGVLHGSPDTYHLLSTGTFNDSACSELIGPTSYIGGVVFDNVDIARTGCASFHDLGHPVNAAYTTGEGVELAPYDFRDGSVASSCSNSGTTFGSHVRLVPITLPSPSVPALPAEDL